jgi:hypothetical protein
MQPKGVKSNVIHVVAGAVEAGGICNRGGIAAQVLGGKAAGRNTYGHRGVHQRGAQAEQRTVSATEKVHPDTSLLTQP